MNTNPEWKLVPVEPTAEMWAAVNKLDDQMAAGGYDGKGASIEQAWNCLVETAPEAPPLTVTVDPDARGVSVGVYQGTRCVYNGAHPIPASTVATEGEKDEQVLHKMNADLCAFYMRWEADGDYLRCRKCKRPQIASYAEKGFPHAAGCKAAGSVEQRPWLTLVELLRPLTGAMAPAAGDALAYGSPEDVAQRIEQYLYHDGRKNSATQLLYEAMKALRGSQQKGEA